MGLIADGLLLAGTMAAAFYCYILARRVRALTNLDTGLGGAITVLARQVDGMKKSVDVAKTETGSTAKQLATMTARAEIAVGRLELLLATLHENTETEEDVRPVSGANESVGT